MAKEKEIQATGVAEKELPEVGITEKKMPTRRSRAKELPKVGAPENTVKIGDQMIEIKPTKLKYHRNNVAAFYKIVDMIPLPEIMQMTAGSFGDERDGDKALMDWLIAVVDDEDLILNNYNEMDTETIERMLSIFKRVNKITEKEEKQKNAVGQMKEA